MANKTKKIAHLTDQWQVRDENGGIFGPVAFSALKSWVEDGRVSPSSEVSRSDGHWELAVRVAELEMNCVAEIDSGSFYGPIHRNAMRGLIQSGSIPTGAIVYTKQCGQEQSGQQPLESGVSQTEHNIVLAQLAANTQELRRLTGERDDNLTQVEMLRKQSAERSELAGALQKEVHAQRAELAASQKESDKKVRAQQAEMAALNGTVDGLQAKIEALGSEREDLTAEIATLRRDNQEQREQFEQREQRQQAELRERVSASTLQINALTSACNQAAEDVVAKNLQLTGLLQRLEELEQANQGLKEEFVNYAKCQKNKRSDDVAQRKLFLIKNLFAEAARVLDGVEDYCEEAVAETQGAAPAGLAEGELLEYEEVLVEELKTRKATPAAAQESDIQNTAPPAPERDNKAGNSKTKKKWLFGSTEKQLGHDSLAELEAQAQIELQRLASSQNISALFDRKK